MNNGPILSDLRDLRGALKSEISDEQFQHHVNDEHNDFADWVEQTLNDPVCAKALRKVKKQQTMITRIDECLKSYNT